MIKQELPGLRYTAFRINTPTHYMFEQTIHRIQRLSDKESFQVSDRVIDNGSTYVIKSFYVNPEDRNELLAFCSHVKTKEEHSISTLKLKHLNKEL